MNPLVSRARQIASNISANPFLGSKLGFRKFFNPTLARKGATQEARTFFQPQLNLGLGNINADFANRGLLRSGLRNDARQKFTEDLNDRQSQMIEQLFNTRQQQAVSAFDTFARQFENDPTGFNRKFSSIFKK